MNSFSQIIVTFASLIVLVKCYPLQNYGHLLEESSGGYGGGEEEHHHKHEPASPYKFGYKVYDPHHGTSFGQNEHSDGETVKGEYQVVLPDGRLQLVTYTADWKTGYHADVQYHGGKTESEQHESIGSSDFGGSHSYEVSSDHGGFSPSYSSSSEHGFGGY